MHQYTKRCVELVVILAFLACSKAPSVKVSDSNGGESIDKDAPNLSWISTPASPTSQTATVFQFDAVDAKSGIESIECRLDNAAAVPCSSPRGFTVAEGNHTLAITAKDKAGNTSVPLTYSWLVDANPPVSVINSGPSTITNQTTAVLNFDASDSGSGLLELQCQLDTGSFSICTSPKTYLALASGNHTFNLRSLDRAHNTSPTVSYSWQVDLAAPTVTITSSPASFINTASASFAFSGSADIVSFQCKLDGGSFSNCSSPKNYTALSEGGHSFSVVGTDGAGNSSAAANAGFSVDLTMPALSITSTPTDPTTNANASFAFTTSDLGSGLQSVECLLDSGSFATCTSPKNYSNLAPGSHNFQVRASDRAGNAITRTYSWRINAVSPIEIYPSPGVNTYLSDQFAVEINDGAVWVSAYVYHYSRTSRALWHNGASPNLSFLTFGTSASVQVRITKLGGTISALTVSPKRKHFPNVIAGGQAIVTLNQNDKAWVVVNGDDANPLFIFADAPKPAVPTGATYFGPGVRDLSPSTGNHYYASNNEVIYIDGGAWLRGNIDTRGKSNVRIMGPGILSGDLWTAEYVQGLSWPGPLDYAMVTGDWARVSVARIEGITIVDSPSYNISCGVDNVYGVKLISPWYWSTDGFQSGVSNVDQSFAFVGDNVFMPMYAGIHNNDVTVTNSFAGTTNNTVFAGGYFGMSPANTRTSFIDNIDIKTYNNDSITGWTRTPAAIQIWVDNTDTTLGYRNQTYQNMYIEGDITVPLIELKNMVHPWSNIGQPAPDPALGNSYNFVFKNIVLEGNQKYRSEIKGWDSSNGFHNVSLENISINGNVVNSSNVSNYFDINSFVWGLVFK